MAKTGAERRRHVLYVTKNTEYHCRDRECVAVRDRRTGKWQRFHAAVRGRLMGSVDPNASTSRRPSQGQRLYFEAGRTVLTSVLQSVARPDRDALFWYTNHACAGVIAA